MVDNPLTLSYDDLLALPMIERDITLTCVSNEVGGPYVSTGRWLGVPFREIIARVGVQPGVDQVFSYSSDSGYTCSTPYAAVSDGRDAMIVVGMNGEPLPDARGFPARMLVPGLFGFVSATKWLERIEFTTYAERTAYWTERDWATDAPILTQSRIEVPEVARARCRKAKPVIAGVAWAQHRGIDKVEIRIDEGDWQEAKLAADAGIDLWRQWSFRLRRPGRAAQRPGAGDRPDRRHPARAADQGLPARGDRLAPDPVHRGVVAPCEYRGCVAADARDHRKMSLPLTVPVAGTAVRPRVVRVAGRRSAPDRAGTGQLCCGGGIPGQRVHSGLRLRGFGWRTAVGCSSRRPTPGSHGLLDSYRVEAAKLALIPAAVPAPRLQRVIDESVEGEPWLILIFDDIEGRPPRASLAAGRGPDRH